MVIFNNPVLLNINKLPKKIITVTIIKINGLIFLPNIVIFRQSFLEGHLTTHNEQDIHSEDLTAKVSDTAIFIGQALEHCPQEEQQEQALRFILDGLILAIRPYMAPAGQIYLQKNLSINTEAMVITTRMIKPMPISPNISFPFHMWAKAVQGS